jgi:Fe-S cluster assembly protein SufD
MVRSIALPDFLRSSFDAFERGLNGDSKSALHAVRRAAMAQLAASGFPTTKHEDWRHTNLSSVLSLGARPAIGSSSAKLDAEQVRALSFPDVDAIRLVFVDGFFAPHFSDRPSLVDGITIASLATARATNAPEIDLHLGRVAPISESPFTALNTAFIQDGAYVAIGDGRSFATPVALIFLTPARDAALAAQPRNLIVAGRNSSVTILERYATVGDGASLTNAVTEIVAAEGARVDHSTIQTESERAHHFGATVARVGRSATVSTLLVSLGGALARRESHTILAGEGGHADMLGLYVAHGKQQMDSFTTIDHVVPNCRSDEVFKGILDDHALGVFRGRIIVRQDAQKTDARQTNRNLLLSDDATVHTKPQLEIYADDVKCTHGATVGQLDDESMFYLRSRGIGTAEASAMLTHAFAGELIRRIALEPIRKELDAIIADRLHHVSME